MKTFTYPITIKEHHLDSFGHVNNATYLTILEEARWELITQNGYGLDVIKKTGLGPVILEINIKFIKELRLREEIIIETRLQSYEGKTGFIEQKMLRKGDLCCTALFTFGLFDTAARRLVLPTPEWAKAVGFEA